MHVAVSSVERLLDYVMNTQADGLRSAASLQTVINIINKNKALIKSSTIKYESSIMNDK
jgi:4-O-beta-D-mannosyl-D-glucose phosphorylase